MAFLKCKCLSQVRQTCLGIAVAFAIAPACGARLNQTSVTCPEGRTFLDGVCVSEPVADYVACVRAQGAQLGAEKSEKLSVDAGYLGVKAGGAAELSETLQKKYAASDQAMLAIIAACNGAAQLESSTARRGGGEMSKSLVAHWTFDEAGGAGVSDASGHGNTGAVQGAVTWVPGRVGGAAKFDATQHVAVEDSSSQHSPAAITITGWFLLAQKDHLGHPWRVIVNKTNPKDGNWWGCGNDPNDPNPCNEKEYGISVNSDDRFLHVTAVTEDRYQSGGHDWCNTSPGTIQFGKWHHVAAIISSKTRAIRVFLDGALMVTCPISEAGLRRTSDKLRIGDNWTGMLDDLRIYAAELTDAEIKRLAEIP